jgi:two-component system sensor histidine kinase KdpD
MILHCIRPYAIALVGVVVVTFAIGLVEDRFHLANSSVLYLIVVLTIASAFGSGPAVVASLVSFLAFDWLFVEPKFTLSVGSLEGWVSLALFLLTAAITGQLAAGQRRRATEAEQREREALVLYDVVRLMSDPNLEYALQAVADRLRNELDLAAVAIELTALPRDVRAVSGDEAALELIQRRKYTPSHVLAAGEAPATSHRGSPGLWIRVAPPATSISEMTSADDQLHQVPIQVEGQVVGMLLVVASEIDGAFTAADNRLLLAVTVQLGLAVERARLRGEATEGEILRRSDELKTALLHTVSHDLRTPLASIITMAGSLRQEDVSWTEEDQRELAADIEHEALRLNRIVGNLLDLSRMEAGGLSPEKGWYDLGALVDDVLGRLRSITAQHAIVIEVPEDLPPVNLDYVEIDQVLSNLIENAVKYTPVGTEVRINVSREESEVRVTVTDRGPGIAPAALPRLFEPFFQIDAPGKRRRGSGLGLAVAHGLIEAHGGRIWAENVRGGGASFSFILPLATLPDPVTAGQTER